MVQHSLTLEDFSLYSPQKQSSYTFNLARMRAKEALLALCAPASLMLATQHSGLELQRETTSEVPHIVNHKKVDSQWVTWSRNEDQRQSLHQFLDKTPLSEALIFNIAPQDKHINLSVVLRENGLFVGLHCSASASIDRRNFGQKLTLSWEREHLAALCAALPAQIMLTIDPINMPAHLLDDSHLLQLSERLLHSPQPLLLGYNMNTNEVVQSSTEELQKHIESSLSHLLTFYQFAAWTVKNDLIDVNKKIQEDKKKERNQSHIFHEGMQVRIIAGNFRGQIGTISGEINKNKAKIVLGKWSLSLPVKDITPVK